MKYKGRELNAPHIILIRLLVWPIMMGLGALMAVLITVGWGWEAGRDFWRGL